MPCRCQLGALRPFRFLILLCAGLLLFAATAHAQRAPRSEVGAWTTPPFPLPNFAINAVVLPTGKVLFWSYLLHDPNRAGQAALWDPARGTGADAFTLVPPPAVDVDGDGDTELAPIFCSSQSLLPDGTVLVTGGLLEDPGYTAPAGHDMVFTFDPWAETWTQQPSLEAGRYYPSQVLLADGTTAILGGYTGLAPGGQFNDQLEVFSADDGDADPLGSIERRPSGDIHTSLYPHLFTLPDADVLLAGPAATDSALLDTATFTWSALPPASRDRVQGSAVLLPGGVDGSWRAAQIGGFAPTPGTGFGEGVASTETIDLGQPSPQWEPDAPLNVPRSHHNTVLLPDGSLLTVGGGHGLTEAGGNYGFDEAQKQVELYGPDGGGWRLGPAEVEPRTYHSVAVLLPDGRVFSGGDDRNPLENGHRSRTDTAEIYSPPYLFKGPRPRIRGAPEAVGFDDGFRIRVRRQPAAEAVLMAPGATTHATDMHQRLVPLEVAPAPSGRGLIAQSPPSSAVAPPGFYMLFALSDAGVPSAAAWIRLGGPG